MILSLLIIGLGVYNVYNTILLNNETKSGNNENTNENQNTNNTKK